MDTKAFLNYLTTQPIYQGQIAHIEHIPARKPSYAELDKPLASDLQDCLAEHRLLPLYTHQAEAVNHVRAGRNVMVSTSSASGKTLCYNIPVLETILSQRYSRALYLFPTKALAQDQLDELHGLITDLGVDIKTFTYDGDTPADARRSVRAAGHIVVTNPDMLHTGILPHHTKWMKLFENLRFVVVDELHQYRGVFGSHVANVLRRLRRVCRFHGTDPVFICCSATIANPRELAERLVGAPVRVVDNNGAPRAEKIVAVYNPPVVNRELGIRRSALKAARGLAEGLPAEEYEDLLITEAGAA